jgi:GT2 family glycosyltransferase
MRTLGPDVVGVGAVVENERRGPDRLWRVRRALGLVPHLVPGRYTRSGHSIPWSFLPDVAGWIEGDWLPGCGMAWRTAPAREVGFHEGFAGYAQGEDLDFSLRMRRRGRLVLVPQARLLHLHEREGRPDPFRLGYMAIRNRWEIHRRGLPDRGWVDVLRFAWSWGVDTLLLLRHLVTRRAGTALSQIAGRVAATGDLLLSRRDRG